MEKEAFKAFCQGRHLTLSDMEFYFGIKDEKTIGDYQSGTLPIPEAVSEKIAEIIFADTAALPASSQEEKLDQLLSVMNQLPHKGAAVMSKIQAVMLQEQVAEIEEKYLGYEVAFWQEFQRLYEKKCRAEKLYVQIPLFAEAESL